MVAGQNTPDCFMPPHLPLNLAESRPVHYQHRIAPGNLEELDADG